MVGFTCEGRGHVTRRTCPIHWAELGEYVDAQSSKAQFCHTLPAGATINLQSEICFTPQPEFAFAGLHISAVSWTKHSN